MRFTFDIVGVTRSQVQAGQLQLQPIDPTNLAAFAKSTLSNLKEVLSAFDPVILGAQPEQTVFIYVLEVLLNITVISDLPDISLYGVIGLDTNTPLNLKPAKPYAREVLREVLTPIVARIVEIPVSLPNMEGLQDSRNYIRNGLGMGFTLKVVDVSGESSNPCLPFPVWLPLPFIGRQLAWKPGDAAVGYKDPPPNPDQQDVANFLGRKALPDPPINPTPTQLAQQADTHGGQVRWYDLQPGNLAQLKLLGVGGTSSPGPYPIPPQGQLALPLPAAGASRLAELRRAGRWLYNECDTWTDDYVHFSPPKDPGVAILWRDDLPSRPILCMDLQEYLFDTLTELAARLWRPVVGSGDLEVKIPIPVGQMVRVGVERLEDAINNELVRFIDNQVNSPDGHLTIKFFFQTSPYVDAENPHSDFNDQNIRLDPKLDPALRQSIGYQAKPDFFSPIFEPGRKGISSSQLTFGYLPQIIPEDADDDSSSHAFTLQLQVMIDGTVSLLGKSIHFDHKILMIGPRIVFVPEPLRLPTLVVFFSNAYFDGIPLIMLPANSGLFKPDIHFDANSPDKLNEVREKVVGKLLELYNLLSLVQKVGQDKTLGLILNALGMVVNAGRMVVDTTGTIESLGACITEKSFWGDHHFNDAISSVVVIGPPYKWSRTVIKCYQHLLRSSNPGLCLRLTLPGDLFLAAIPNFKHLLEKYVINGMTVELPYGSQPGDPPSVGNINFNDVVTSIEIVREKEKK